WGGDLAVRRRCALTRDERKRCLRPGTPFSDSQLVIIPRKSLELLQVKTLQKGP
ncbi:unnamed protein product, partial [Urochloa humidicola]